MTASKNIKSAMGILLVAAGLWGFYRLFTFDPDFDKLDKYSGPLTEDMKVTNNSLGYVVELEVADIGKLYFHNNCMKMQCYPPETKFSAHRGETVSIMYNNSSRELYEISSQNDQFLLTSVESITKNSRFKILFGFLSFIGIFIGTRLVLSSRSRQAAD